MQSYIFIGFQYDYSRICLGKYIENANNFFFRGTGKSEIMNKIQKFHCCESINKHIDLPFKNIWFNDFSDINIKSNDSIYFIFSKSQSWLLQYKDGKYIKILRNKYPNCKIILYLWDLIESFYKFDVSFFTTLCDCVLTYDAGDAKQYGLIYCPTPYTKISVENNSSIDKFDVFFCGKAKNRLGEILEVYEYLKMNNLSCHFFITDVPKNMQKYQEDIVYNKPISYYENLQYLQKARFVLDIVQKGSRGDTLRIKEAVTYGKKIITNNSEVKNNKYYLEENICVFNKVNDIQKDFLNDRNTYAYENMGFDEFTEILNAI